MIGNEGQEQIINKGVQHLLYSYEQVFEYDGEAGTGKSYVLQEIPRRAGYKSEEVLAMAYTGAATIVMRTKGFHYATTIHSALYELIEVPEEVSEENSGMNETFNTVRMVEKFVKRESLDPIYKVMVIDEGGMVPDYMKRDIESFGLKIIVTGDKGQLPPVKANPAYLYKDDIPHLTQLMRQSEHDGVVYLARRARYGLPISTGCYGNALVIEYSDLNDSMIQCSNIVLCGTNKTRNLFNDYIRSKLLGIHDTLPVFGDRMICRKNNHHEVLDGIYLANGLVGSVRSFPDVTKFSGKTYKIDFQPDLLNTTFKDLECDYQYLIGDIETRNKIKNSKYCNSELFEYAYASTTHLAQGSEYDKGIYIEEYMGSNMQNNLNYTGITRFRNACIYVKKSKKFY